MPLIQNTILELANHIFSGGVLLGLAKRKSSLNEKSNLSSVADLKGDHVTVTMRVNHRYLLLTITLSCVKKTLFTG